MAKAGDKVPSTRSPQAAVDAFVDKVRTLPAQRQAGERGRLIFALDATASREPTWDMAAEIQGQMFVETAALGGLDIQLAFYRGFGEFKASRWAADGESLLGLMTGVHCLAGQTQIGKVLIHAANETKKRRVNALVFVGDAFEEDIDDVGHAAGALGLLGVPAFMFQEGANPIAGFAFQQIAKLTNGAYCRFDATSARVLKELLSAVAVYAAGGPPALENLASERGGEILKIAHQVKGR